MLDPIKFCVCPCMKDDGQLDEKGIPAISSPPISDATDVLRAPPISMVLFLFSIGVPWAVPAHTLLDQGRLRPQRPARRCRGSSERAARYAGGLDDPGDEMRAKQQEQQRHWQTQAYATPPTKMTPRRAFQRYGGDAKKCHHKMG
jgi:arginine/lysine/ornithine decarboxylase